MVAINTHTPKYLSPSPNWAIAVSSSGLFMKLTKRPRMRGSNANTFFTSWRYSALSSRLSMFMKALLYTRCMPSVRTK